MDVLGSAVHLKAVSLLQKELGQKDRLLKQYQAKLEEALRKLSEASYQQVGTRSATDFTAPVTRTSPFLMECLICRWIWNGSWNTKTSFWLTV